MASTSAVLLLVAMLILAPVVIVMVPLYVLERLGDRGLAERLGRSDAVGGPVEPDPGTDSLELDPHLQEYYESVTRCRECGTRNGAGYTYCRNCLGALD